MPANRRGIKKNLGALHGSQPGSFRVPLVPTDQHPDFCIARLPRAKAQVPRSEVKFFVIKRIIRNVHFAVTSQQRAIGIDDDCGIVINAGGAFFKQGGNDHDLLFFCEFLKRLSSGSRDWLCQLKKPVVFGLAEVL